MLIILQFIEGRGLLAVFFLPIYTFYFIHYMVYTWMFKFLVYIVCMVVLHADV